MKICITGDSWACGEWGYTNTNFKKYQCLHGGIGYFLQQSHEVTNVAKPGASNFASISRLKTALDQTEFDFIFWFQTDPLRDANTQTFESYSLVTIEDVLQEHSRLLELAYSRINNLDCKIHVIGGASKINVDLIKKFSNLTPYIKSLPELFAENYQHPELWQSTWISLILNKIDLESLDKLIEYKNLQDDLGSDQYAKYFRPDGRHINRVGHEQLYKKIVEDFKL